MVGSITDSYCFDVVVVCLFVCLFVLPKSTWWVFLTSQMCLSVYFCSYLKTVQGEDIFWQFCWNPVAIATTVVFVGASIAAMTTPWPQSKLRRSRFIF